MPKVNTLNDLFIEELQILLSGEEQLIEALPKMARAATARELRDGFEEHLAQTKIHAQKVRQLLGQLSAPQQPMLCPAMQGLIKAGESRAQLDSPAIVRDAALIIAGQRVEHFEIAGYGSAKTFANLLGHEDFAEVLEEIEEEEADADKTLSSIAQELTAEALAQTT